MEHAVNRLWNTEDSLGQLALGGTAVGTGINTHKDFARLTISGIATETGLALLEATNHFDAQANLDELVEASGALRTAAVSLIKIANDIRWLGSGPRCGLGELKLPPAQPGTATLPGKVNPVLCEMVIKVGLQVIGNDAAVAAAGTFGEFQLNTMITVAAYNLLQSVDLLSAASRSFARQCVCGIEADHARCESTLERSLAMSAALAPVIGHDQAANIARLAQEQGRSVREVALDIAGLEPARLDSLLDPARQTEPGAVFHLNAAPFSRASAPTSKPPPPKPVD